MKRALLAGILFFMLVQSKAILAQTTNDINEIEEIGEIVVTATRVETPVREVGSSVTVITSEEIEKKQEVTILEVLRDAPGLDVVQSGGSGHNTSVFIRGGNSGHTLVMIDGVQVNSPTLGGYDFSGL
ncbi:MAG: TonB-dependent receptor plug domain-containing protein, partial [Thermodesulfobacteriota bacterium]